MKKYEFTGEIKVQFGVSFQRIRNLSTGEIGGWIESEANLSQYGKAQVSGDAWVYGKARVSGDAQVSGKAQVYGDAWVYGDAQVYNVIGLIFNVTITPQNIAVGYQLYTHSVAVRMTQKQAEAEGLPKQHFKLMKAIIQPLCAASRKAFRESK